MKRTVRGAGGLEKTEVREDWNYRRKEEETRRGGKERAGNEEKQGEERGQQQGRGKGRAGGQRGRKGKGRILIN